jgi:hypothetical protein
VVADRQRRQQLVDPELRPVLQRHIPRAGQRHGIATVDDDHRRQIAGRPGLWLVGAQSDADRLDRRERCLVPITVVAAVYGFDAPLPEIGDRATGVHRSRFVSIHAHHYGRRRCLQER